MNGLDDLDLYGNWIIEKFKNSNKLAISATIQALFKFTHLEK